MKGRIHCRKRIFGNETPRARIDRLGASSCSNAAELMSVRLPEIGLMMGFAVGYTDEIATGIS